MDIISLTSHISGQLLIVNTNKIVVIFRKTSRSSAISAGLNTQDKNSKGTGCLQAADELPVLYLILREGAGVDSGVGRAFGARDF